MYCATTGTFLQRDPLGQFGNTELLYSDEYVTNQMRSRRTDGEAVPDLINLYAYVSNNPTNFTDPLGLLKIKIGGMIFYVHENDPDPFPSNPHAHLNSPNSSYKVNINDGQIFKGATPTGKAIPKKVLDSLRNQLRGKGLLCIGAAVILVTPDIIQAAQANGPAGAAQAGGQFVVDAAAGTVVSAATGTAITAGAAAAGTSVTVGGAAVTGIVGATGVGSAVIIVGGTAYMGGTFIGQTQVGGQTIHSHIGNTMYLACPWCFNW